MRELFALATLASMIFGGPGNSGQLQSIISLARNGGPVAIIHELFSNVNDGSQAIRIISVPVTGKFSGKFH